MPSLFIDKAAADAQEKIDDAISNITNNLSPKKQPSQKVAPSSSSSRHHDYSSPLFRDEVVQQEMRYFDQVLRDNNGAGGCGYNLPAYKPSFGVSVEGSNHNDSSQKQRQSNSPKRSNTSPVPKLQNQIHHRQSKQSNRHVRSRNIRQNTNRKLLLRAKITSRRVMRKLSGIGKTCSKKWDKVANAIHHRILEAMASMNSLLEDDDAAAAGCRQRSAFAQRVVNSQVQRNQTNATSIGNVNRTDHGNSSNKNTGILPGTKRAPPRQIFTGTTTWLKKRTEIISSKAIAKAKDSIRNRKESLIV